MCLPDLLKYCIFILRLNECPLVYQIVTTLSKFSTNEFTLALESAPVEPSIGTYWRDGIQQSNFAGWQSTYSAYYDTRLQVPVLPVYRKTGMLTGR